MSLIVDIRKDLGKFKLQAAFEARDGITSLLGPSGCGKSLTLKCIAGIEKPDRGHIELDGRVKNRPLPEVELVDMRRELQQGNNTVLSGRLAAALGGGEK